MRLFCLAIVFLSFTGMNGQSLAETEAESSSAVDFGYPESEASSGGGGICHYYCTQHGLPAWECVAACGGDNSLCYYDTSYGSWICH
jgi:hypothetical protein